MVEDKQPLTVYIERNCNDVGMISFDMGDDTFTLVFPETKEMYYQSLNYYIPAIGGKGKVIKKKNIIITDYDFIPGDMTYSVDVTDTDKGTRNNMFNHDGKFDNFHTRNVILVKKFQVIKTKA